MTVCREELAGQTGPVVIVTGDSPLVARRRSAPLAEREKLNAACISGTAHKEIRSAWGAHCLP